MPQCEFLGWSQPFLGLAVDWLWARRPALPSLLVVVPTAQAGRRLREALAERGACLAPRVVTPEEFFRVAGDEAVAAEAEERLAWIEALRELRPGELPSLFPVEPVERSFAWASGVAEELMSVRETLVEGGRGFADVAAVSPETGRWEDLQRLEGRVLARLARWGKGDRASAKRARAETFRPPPETRRVVIAGVPDPVKLAETAWAGLEAAGVPVDVLVHAPESEAAHFDAWGRPVDDGQTWSKRPTPVGRDQVHLTAGPAELGSEIVRLCAGRASDGVSAGLCDPAYGPAVEAAFERVGWKAWNPEGRVAGRAMALLLGSFSSWLRQPTRWEPVAELLRNPALPAVAGGSGWHAALRALDELEAEYLPPDAKRARELVEWRIASEAEKGEASLATRGPSDGREETRGPGEGWEKLREALAWAEVRREELAKGSVGLALGGWTLDLQRRGVDDGAEGKWLEALEAAAKVIAGMEARGWLKDAGDALELALGGIGALRSASGREDAVIDLSGWLELSYERADRLVLAGFHEGSVPDGSLDDGFLPDAVKKELGLRDAASRFARDAYLFHALAASRRVEVVVAKVDPNGEPRKPSRLLLVAKGAELAERVRELFGEPEGEGKRPSGWARGDWKLTFDGEPVGYFDTGRRLSPSALRDYLHCPFRFYLKRILKWERYESGKLELDALDFGNLCHGALEAMGRDLRESEDAEEIREFLVAKMDETLRRYGSPLPLPLMVQREAAVSRLGRFAEIEVGQRRDGWRTVEVEWNIGESPAWELDGQALTLQIDRVDRHPDLGYRVLDYKSSGKAVSPEAAHWAPVSGKRRAFGEFPADAKGKERAWKNLQLPLYAAFVQRHFGLSEPPQAGYVNLPAALNEVEFKMWPGFGHDTVASALEWTRGVIGALRRKVHWPPVELAGNEAAWDDFAALAPDGLAEAVDGGMIEALQAIAESYEAERQPA